MLGSEEDENADHTFSKLVAVTFPGPERLADDGSVYLHNLLGL